MVNRISFLRSLTAGAEPANGGAEDYGRLAINLTDRKAWVYGATGTPSLVASFVGDHRANRSYRIGDLVVKNLILYRCAVNINPKAFTATDWVAVSDDRATLLYRTPTAQAEATQTMGAAGLSFRVVAHAAQSAALQEWWAGGIVTADIRSDGYPGQAFGRTVFRVNQVAHSFSATGQPARFDGTSWVLADPNTAAGFAMAVVSRVIDANTVDLQVSGRIDGMQAGAFASGAYAANTLYYASVATPGKLTATPPPNPTDENIVLRTLSGGSAVLLMQVPGAAASATNSYDLQVNQSPNPFTAVGQLAAYDGAEWVRADPTAFASLPVAVVKATSGLDFTLCFGGEVTSIVAGAAASFPLVAGTVYYSNVNGRLTATEPLTSVTGARPVLIATSGSSGIVLAGINSPDALRATRNLTDLTDVPEAITALGLNDVVRTARTIAAGTGLTGGGDLSANRTLALDTATVILLGAASTAVQPARSVTTDPATGLAGGGDLSADRTLGLTGQALAIHQLSGTGITVRTGANTFTTRQISSGDGVTVTNGSGVAGNPSVAVDATVARTSRSITAGDGLTGGGTLAADRTLSLTGQALALHNIGTNGLIARTGLGLVAARTLVNGTGITVTNGDGVAGNPSAALTGQALALHNLVTSGIIVRTGAGTVAGRTLTGTADQLTVTNGDGVAGNPIVAAVVPSVAEARAFTDNTKLMTPLRTAQAFNVSGSAPMFACRAWVNFDGTGTPTIKGSGNVASITDLDTGRYRINFTVAMPDANYAVAGMCTNWTPSNTLGFVTVAADVTGAPIKLAASVTIETGQSNSTGRLDFEDVSVAIFC